MALHGSKDEAVTITAVQPSDTAALDVIVDAAHQAQVFPTLSETGIAALEEGRSLRWQMPLNDAQHGSLVARLGDIIVGYIRWREGHFIYALYVALAYQRRGIGRQLLAAMLAQTEARDIQLRASINAVGFYQRLGFVSQGEPAVIRGIRCLPMRYRR